VVLAITQKVYQSKQIKQTKRYISIAKKNIERSCCAAQKFQAEPKTFV
jgi:hypothetical protein